MPSTLVVAKSQLGIDLKKILRDAAYEAQVTCKSDGSDEDIKKVMHKHIEEAAKKFADKFAEEAAKPMAEAIYKFTKEIGIVMTPKGTLLCAAPGSPVVGAVPMTDFNII